MVIGFQHQFEKTFLPAIYEPRLLMFDKTSIELEKTSYYKDHAETFGYNQCVSIYMTLEIENKGNASLYRNYHDYIISNVQKDRVVDTRNNAATVKFCWSISQEGIMSVCYRCCGLMGY